MYDRNRNSVFWASMFSSLITGVITNPIQVIKLRKQASLTCCTTQNCQICIPLFQLSFKDYFRGLQAYSKVVVISNGLFFQTYEFLLRIFKEKGINQKISYFTSSLLSRALVSFITIPLQNKRIKTSLNDKQAALAYRGIRATVLRDISFSAMYWPLVQITRKQFFTQQYRLSDKSKQMLFVSNMISAIISGAFCALITTPLDIIKTRLQANQTNTNGIVQGLRQIINHKGLKGLFKGVQYRLLKAMIHCSSILVLYQQFNSVFKKYDF